MVFSFFIIFAPDKPILVTKLWTITRRTITICNGGGWRARLLIPLPLNYALCIVNYALKQD